MVDAKKLKLLTSNLKVLYVEDDELLRVKTTQLLGNLFSYVTTAQDGQEGLDKYKQDKYDIVISDINMPNMNGIDMAKHIKDIDPNQVVIITSAHDDTSYLLKLIDIGIDHFILKPIDISKLLQVIFKVATIIDQTNEIELKNSLLIQSSRLTAMGEMAGMIAHQWRQPLSSISLRLQSLKLMYEFGEVDIEKSKSEINSVNEIVQTMSKTIDDFRDFFKPNDEKTLFSLQNTIDDTLKLYNDLSDNNITITIDNNQDIQIKNYNNTLSQVIYALIVNSHDALIANSIDNPKIDISIIKTDKEVILSIKDNGGGIDVDNLDKIFDPYFSTKSKNAKGLGLYNAKIAIENYIAGNIDAKNIDDGVIFTITIPLDDE